MEKTLQEIREAEVYAEKLLTEAHEKSALIIAKGKADAESFIAERRQSILAEKAETLSQQKKEFEKEYQKYTKKAEKGAEKFAAECQQNINKAVRFFVGECKKAIIR